MRGRKITPEQIETLKQVYAETENLSRAAHAAGVGLATASHYVRSRDEFEEVRKAKRVDFIAEVVRVRQLYIEHLGDPEVMKTADARDAAAIIGTLTDKHQLLTGQATERREQRDITTVRQDLKQRINLMAERRRTVDDGDGNFGVVGGVDGPADRRTG